MNPFIFEQLHGLLETGKKNYFDDFPSYKPPFLWDFPGFVEVFINFAMNISMTSGIIDVVFKIVVLHNPNGVM
jgi:hypothetical protein